MSWQRKTIPCLTIALVVLADQLSKMWIRANLAIGESLSQEGFLRITHVTNSGSVFGLFPNQIAIPIIFISILLIVGILYLYYRNLLPRKEVFHLRNTYAVTIGLLIGGIIGNLIDRLSMGYVTDFISVHLWGSFYWPTFNIADSAIVIGVILLAYYLLSTHGKYS